MLRFFHQLSLATKAATLIAVLVFSCCALLVLANSIANQHLLEQSTRLLAADRVQHIARNAVPLIENDDRLSLQTLLRQHTDNPMIIHAEISDAEGRMLVESGERRGDSWQLRAAIEQGRDNYGEAVLTLQSRAMANEINLLAWQLLFLSGVLAAVAWVVVNHLIRGLEEQLAAARDQLRSPVSDHGPSQYPGDDALGGLLKDIHRPPLNTKPEQSWGAIRQVVLQIRWQRFELLRQQWDQASFQQLQKEAYERSAAVARLYRAEIQVRQIDGVTLYFNHRRSEDEGVFYALCCALLINDLGLELGAHPRISVLEASGNHWQVEAARLALSEELHGHEDSNPLPLLLLDEPELHNAAARAELDGNHLKSLKEPYQKFLLKQLLKLKSG